MTIIEALNKFKQALDKQLEARNMNDNDNSTLPLGIFHLSTPCLSSDESKSKSTMLVDKELIVEYPPTHLPELPLLDFPSHPTSAEVHLLPAEAPCATSAAEEVSLAPNARVFVASSLVAAPAKVRL